MIDSLPHYITRHDLFMLAGSTVFLLAVYFGEELLRRVLNYAGSFSRKCIHVIVALWGCWVYFGFEHKEVAVVLPVLFIIANIHPIRSRIFRFSGIKDTFHPGMLYYPVSMFLLFWFCWGSDLRWAGIISLLNLGLGDSAAWIIGSRFGIKHYAIGESKKSYIGGIAMLAVCLVSTGTVVFIARQPLGIHDISAIMGISVGATLLEAVCARGLDNISVPLGSALIYSFFYQ